MLEKRLREYIDANVPIIYINSHDDLSVEGIVLRVTGRRTVWEWNQMDGLLNRKEIKKKEITGIHEPLDNERTLSDFLKIGVRDQEFDRKVILVKDIAAYLEDAGIIALLKMPVCG